MKKIVLTTVFLALFSGLIFAQDDEQEELSSSVIQTLTPSKLIAKGQFDIKWFNNLYTETKSTFVVGKKPRETFFTSSLDVFTGISENRRVNIGVLLELRSNVIAGRNALDVFSFDGERGTARSGLTSIAPAIKFVPFASVNNFSIQSSFSIPLHDQETEQGVFLDQKGFTWQNRFFFDKTLNGGMFQIFTELNSELNFGEKAISDSNGDTVEGSFANDSLNLTPGIFLSYFPIPDFTVLVLAQHSQRIDLGNDFEQDFTAIGGGVKYQLTKVLNAEALYTNFVRGNNTGLGQTFNLGLRAVL